ncbi:hypothetical protein I601_1032 [Nocardioides dokdonensis FR1436]|uniref:Uncharacterized protein n=1 Tax=Nocardioides dokdonensis FR1436 TaxID=1300347 RepID=A0A1A9GGW4_9ACTN|nr:hypothetical protein [Nocardioides dokdonensis]ANH37474.1 hypothetical protein I601_1032 [Nocardioides dokdonensis FR1436]
MSWGDVWVNGDKVRPEIDATGPRAPWIPAGVISAEERAFVEATQALRRTRDAHARAVEFDLQVTSSAVSKERSGTGKSVVGFEPDGLWLAVDVTPAGSPEGEARFVVFTQRVHVIARAHRAAKRGTPGRPRGTISLRGRARSRESPLEWGHPAARD